MIKTNLILLFIVISTFLSAQTLISQYDFLNADLGIATTGSNAVGYNTSDARLAAGGGVYFINNGGAVGIDLEIPRADFETLQSVTFSFDYMRLESYATFFEMDYFKFHMDGGQVKIEYRVADNSSTIVFNTGYNLISNQRDLLKVTYEAATGTMSVYRNNTLQASNVTTAGKNLAWPLSGNAFVGKKMDGSGSSTASLYQFQIYDAANSTLPIELTQFDGDRKGDNNEIKWTTASETNNQYFEIQRSTDNENFETIALIDGAGNSNSLINYSYTDNNIVNYTLYYKLKQVDFDGKFEYSNTIAISGINKASINVYPNPVSVNTTFSISTEEGSRVIIYNSIGQVIDDYNTQSREPHKNFEQSGIYYIVLFDELGNQISSKRLIVK